MPDDGHSIDGPALKTVVSMIKDLEFQVSVEVSLKQAKEANTANSQCQP